MLTKALYGILALLMLTQGAVVESELRAAPADSIKMTFNMLLVSGHLLALDVVTLTTSTLLILQARCLDCLGARSCHT